MIERASLFSRLKAKIPIGDDSPVSSPNRIDEPSSLLSKKYAGWEFSGF